MNRDNQQWATMRDELAQKMWDEWDQNWCIVLLLEYCFQNLYYWISEPIVLNNCDVSRTLFDSIMWLYCNSIY
jgi:hypothetical protein